MPLVQALTGRPNGEGGQPKTNRYCNERVKMRYRTLRLSEIAPIVDDYQRLLPGDWEREGKDALVREATPVMQCVWFERLQIGEYRPRSNVRILTAPRGSMLHQFLDFPLQSIRPEEHRAKCERVARAMRETFIPRIDEPLDPHHVVQLCVARAQEVPTMHGAYVLATYSAYCEDRERFEHWKATFERLGAEFGMRPDWYVENEDLLAQADRWLREGRARDEFERIIAEQRESYRSRAGK